MGVTASRMLPLGTEAPEFELPDTEGEMVSLGDLSDGRGLCVVFMCNHCPYVKHIQHLLAEVAGEYQEKEIRFVGINSNDIEAYPQDRPERMKEDKERFGYPFPYLYDESQETARAYRAACTPDIYLFDDGLELVYRGQFDPSRPGRGETTGEDLVRALDALLKGKRISEADQRPSAGCNIKWKLGNAPPI
ncbi:MAG: thioredoxin family protein [bacterium]